ncbi:MAG: hypothetical protein AAGB48_04030 [Planctomycetota bacterium]
MKTKKPTSNTLGALRIARSVTLWLALGFAVQTLVAWAVGFNPQGWSVRIPRALVTDDGRVSAMFANDRYSLTVSHGFAPLRNEFRIRYSDLGTPDKAEAYVGRWRVASLEVAASDPIYAGERTVRDAPPGMQVFAAVDSVAGIPTRAVLPGGDREIGGRDELSVMVTGWPWRSCRMTWIERDGGELEPFRGALIDADTIPRSWMSGMSMYYPGEETLGAIPARPMLAGTLGNTAVYAAVFWSLVAAAGLVRRRLRVIRGRCAACGYSLAGVRGPCPECGDISDSR